MYENGKMRAVKTIPAMGRGEIKDNDGGVNSITIYCKSFCNVTVYPQSRNTA
jgi:hypothetical protein